MAIDLEKLTPAPWVVVDSRGTPDHFTCPRTGEIDEGAQICSISEIFVPEGKDEENSCSKWPYPVLAVEFSEGRFKEEPVDLQFIALARNAFDVMLRRKWIPYFGGDHWFPMNSVTGLYARELLTWEHPNYDDPFTCLVEADQWCKERGK